MFWRGFHDSIGLRLAIADVLISFDQMAAGAFLIIATATRFRITVLVPLRASYSMSLNPIKHCMYIPLLNLLLCFIARHGQIPLVPCRSR